MPREIVELLALTGDSSPTSFLTLISHFPTAHHVDSICIFKLAIIILISIMGLKPLLALNQCDFKQKSIY